MSTMTALKNLQFARRNLSLVGLAIFWIVMAGACSAISVSISVPPTAVGRTPSPFPISYSGLGHVLASDNWAGDWAVGIGVSSTIPCPS